jgi:hypothetical protein
MHLVNVHKLRYRDLYSEWLRAGRPRGRSLSPGKVKNFLFPAASRPAEGLTQPPIQCVWGPPCSRLKRQGREADHSPSTSAQIKIIWIYASTPTYVYMAQCLIS